MKYGIVAPNDSEAPKHSQRQTILEAFKAYRNFLLFVILPTVCVAGYFFLFAADQFESKSDFIVKSAGNSTPPSGGFGQLLGLAGSSPADGEVASVSDYLQSHDVVTALQRRGIDLASIFRRPEADLLSRLATPTPTPETLLRFYRGKVHVHLDHDTGITELSVKTFRPEDSYKLAQALLDLGEQRVNLINKRRYEGAVGSASRQLADAEAAAAELQSRITRFRESSSDVDPQSTSEAQIKLVSELNTNLAGARARLATMGSSISHESPQYVALQDQISSLQREITFESSKLTGGNAPISGPLGDYEVLKVKQEFAGKNYEAAAADLERARAEARQQQLYVVRVVEPNVPVKSLYPKRGQIVLTVFLGLLLAYSIGWLIVAGVREHAA